MNYNLTELINALTRMREANFLPPDAPVKVWLMSKQPKEPLARMNVSGVGAGYCRQAKSVCATLKLSDEA